ncbi:MAG: hypothetical protein KKF30_07240 [Proteobacteria bacterium]|nr:hypothetical protein [Pseudomonadota bacterium]MBU4471717.1 hypothetical protein [Pseudomonadota bacterium]MCG2750691.1 hypothetical protein [Desulfobacteraceae bacterium]
MLIDHTELPQMTMSGGAGIMGLGIGIGMFRSMVTQVKKDLESIKMRQARLRGEDVGGLPLYMLRSACDAVRMQCTANAERRIDEVFDDLIQHANSIKALDNFARWWMQKEGMKIEDINRILGS